LSRSISIQQNLQLRKIDDRFSGGNPFIVFHALSHIFPIGVDELKYLSITFIQFTFLTFVPPPSKIARRTSHPCDYMSACSDAFACAWQVPRADRIADLPSVQLASGNSEWVLYGAGANHRQMKGRNLCKFVTGDESTFVSPSPSKMMAGAEILKYLKKFSMVMAGSKTEPRSIGTIECF
jgi:hypothetical protein